MKDSRWAHGITPSEFSFAELAAYGLGVEWAMSHPGVKIPTEYRHNGETFTLSTKSRGEFGKQFRRGVREIRNNG
jgi:hypothetical protein